MGYNFIIQQTVLLYHLSIVNFNQILPVALVLAIAINRVLLFITWMNLHQYLHPNMHLIPMFLYRPILHHIWLRLLGYHPMIILIFIQLCLMMDLLQDIAIIFLKLLLLLVPFYLVQSYRHGFRGVQMLHYSKMII
jgi:hypothetical protein